MVSTTDFFYPLVDDPYTQGLISCANVVSDMYAVGITDIDNMLMILGASTDMVPDVREIATRETIRGFVDMAKEAGTKVSGGQSVLNPWPIIGGVAQSVVPRADVLSPRNAVPGDVLVLTKPLGMQVAVNLHQWLDDPEQWSAVSDVITKAEAIRAYNLAAASMCRLNRNAALLLAKHSAHAATDVTGFGIIGHANNLAANQACSVDFVLHTLPVISGMARVNAAVRQGGRFKLTQGLSAETSGGLLVCLPGANASAYCEDLRQLDGWTAFTVGDVVEGVGTARLSEKLSIVNVFSVWTCVCGGSVSGGRESDRRAGGGLHAL